jgi:hypothetical protein
VYAISAVRPRTSYIPLQCQLGDHPARRHDLYGKTQNVTTKLSSPFAVIPFRTRTFEQLWVRQQGRRDSPLYVCNHLCTYQMHEIDKMETHPDLYVSHRRCVVYWFGVRFPLPCPCHPPLCAPPGSERRQQNARAPRWAPSPWRSCA